MSSIVLYGPPGTGKTTMACSMCKLGYKVHLIDVDNKALKMHNLKDYVSSGQLFVYPIVDKLIEDDLKLRVLKPGGNPIKQPKGYLSVIDLITKFEKEPPEDSLDKHVIVGDSMSRIEEHMIRLLSYLKVEEGYTKWRVVKSNYEELFSTFWNLPFKHQILIYHSQVEEDQITGKKQFKPLLDGQVKDKVGKDVEEMYFLKLEIGRNGVEYKAVTKPIERVQQARTSRDLPLEVPADFSIIFKEEKL